MMLRLIKIGNMFRSYVHVQLPEGTLPGASHLPFTHPLPPTEERPADSLRYWSWLHLPRDLGSEHQGSYHLGYALDMRLRPKDKSTGVPHVGLTTGITELPSGKLTSLCIPNSYVSHYQRVCLITSANPSAISHGMIPSSFPS